MSELHKLSVRLYPGDFERLQSRYPRSGASKALRALLRKFLDSLDAIDPSQIEVDLSQHKMPEVKDQ